MIRILKKLVMGYLKIKQQAYLHLTISVFFLLTVSFQIQAQVNKIDGFTEYQGQVFNFDSSAPISDVHLFLNQTSITGITNKDGEFSFKVPDSIQHAVISFSKVGYETKNVQLDFLNPDFTKITLTAISNSEELDEVSVYAASDARAVVEKALKNRYIPKGKQVAFYREKIDRGRRNVMLGEAVLQINADKNAGGEKGQIALYKSRKSTDYKRLDTLAVKLKGGPYSAWHMNVSAYPQYLFYENTTDDFSFEFDTPENHQDQFIYVINFEQNDKNIPWFFGKIYIDPVTNSFVKIQYSLNVDNRNMARRMLVVKKPKRVKVTPLEAEYQAEYVEQDGKWYYLYGSFHLKIRVNWKGKLFNSRYDINTEMAVTDRGNHDFFPLQELKVLKPSVVMADDISGFADTEFWGIHNIIQPDQSIKDAMDKIYKKIKTK